MSRVSEEVETPECDVRLALLCAASTASLFDVPKPDIQSLHARLPNGEAVTVSAIEPICLRVRLLHPSSNWKCTKY